MSTEAYQRTRKTPYRYNRDFYPRHLLWREQRFPWHGQLVARWGYELADAYQFFRNYYSPLSEGASRALELARAEVWAKEKDYEILTQEEDECYRDIYGDIPDADRVERGELECICVLLAAPTSDRGIDVNRRDTYQVLQSLGMVTVKPGDPEEYIRYLGAELAEMQFLEEESEREMQEYAARRSTLWSVILSVGEGAA